MSIRLPSRILSVKRNLAWDALLEWGLKASGWRGRGRCPLQPSAICYCEVA